ncbi:DUF4440 domain-containing protein [Chromobacterium phragmitis]|nr:DUF4440 domain-containing protein [Chromobacterium phragmitis]
MDMAETRQSDGLLTLLRGKEAALHRFDVRRDPDLLDALLNDGFHEIGRSGREYGKQSIIASLLQESADDAPEIRSQDYRLTLLADNVALLNYRSAHLHADGRVENHALRASIWKKTNGVWRLAHHQGTPTDRFPVA